MTFLFASAMVIEASHRQLFNLRAKGRMALLLNGIDDIQNYKIYDDIQDGENYDDDQDGENYDDDQDDENDDDDHDDENYEDELTTSRPVARPEIVLGKPSFKPFTGPK